MEINYCFDGFFQAASDDFERLSESEVVSASRHVKLIKIKKVNTRPRRPKSKHSNKTPRSSKLKSSKVEKTQKKVWIKYHLDSSEEVILDLDSKTKNLIEQFEDFVNNNNHSDASSPKTPPTATSSKLRSCNPHDENSSRKQFSSHSRPREWTKKESELQERMALALSTLDSKLEEKMSNFPKLRPETIVGVTRISGELYFIVDWDGDRRRIVKPEEAYRRISMTWPEFCESHFVWNTAYSRP